MRFNAGTKLGTYEIVEPLGVGGMGEVYRARDSKLKREVAIKVLPDAFARDTERVARFQREAEVLASLNHPHIAAIYDLAEFGLSHFLVLELVKGETLVERIARGPIPVEEALLIAKQIAEALGAAHDKGIIHRDLKPANIKLTSDGNVKVLDFGLAKVRDSEGADLSNSPTMMSASMPGILLGTPGYMSPEQAKGRAADRTSDVWAFGCVLYEMLTGERPFKGESVIDKLAAALNHEPDWLRVPVQAQRLVRRCLEKDPRRRLRDMGDAFPLLDDPPQPAPVSNRTPWAVAGALALALAIALWALWQPGRTPAQRPTVSVDIELGAEADISATGSNMILSPDAVRLIIVSRGTDGMRRLFRRTLNESRAEPLPGTEAAYNPFFSPDGKLVGFFAGGKLKKTPVGGGEVTTLCDAPAGRGGTWSEDGNIVVALDTRVGLSIIPAAGGPAVPLTELNPERQEASHRLPHFVPGGRAVIFTASADPADYHSADIEVVSLEDRGVKILLKGVGSDGRYIANGHIVYVNTGRLFAVPFDIDRLEVRGSPISVLEGVASSGATGTAQVDFSLNGHIVYQRGPDTDNVTMQWLDETGKTALLLSEPGNYQFPALSPDGSLLAATQDGGIWVYDWQRERRTLLTTGKTRGNAVPLWTPDGRYIVFRAAGGIFWTRADGAGPPQPLIESRNFLSPLALTPDGKNLAYSENVRTGVDLLIAALENDSAGLRAGKPELYLKAPSANTLASFSADGRWLAYASTKSGIYEVYVRAFPDNGSEWLISNGGHMPVWSRSGRELFYRTEDGRVMMTTYTAKGHSFVADKPRQWTNKRLAYSGLNRNFDLAPDGKRLVAGLQVESRELPGHVLLVLDFFDGVRRRMDAGK